MKKILALLAYIAAAGGGLGAAYFVTSSLIKPAYSQAPDANLSVPGEEKNLPPPPPPSVPDIPPGPEAGNISMDGPEPVGPTPVDVNSEAVNAPTAIPVAETPMRELTPAEQRLEKLGIKFDSMAYIYDPSGKRDPFRPLPAIRGMTLGGQPVEPLEKFDLEQLKLVGILWDTKKPKAMVKDPTGKVHMVYPNTKMGKRNGYIRLIREGEVVVIESIVDEDKTVKNAKVLVLKK